VDTSIFSPAQAPAPTTANAATATQARPVLNEFLRLIDQHRR
jgi:hypothetical protein